MSNHPTDSQLSSVYCLYRLFRKKIKIQQIKVTYFLQCMSSQLAMLNNWLQEYMHSLKSKVTEDYQR